MRWLLIIKEFGPELKNIKGENNVVSDTLSRLKFMPNTTKLNIAKRFGYDNKDIPLLLYLIRYYDIDGYQNKDKDLLSKINSHKNYEL